MKLIGIGREGVATDSVFCKGPLSKGAWIPVREVLLPSLPPNPFFGAWSQAEFRAGQQPTLAVNFESNGLKSQWTLVTRLIARPDCLKFACAISFVVLAFSVYPQTYQVGSDAQGNSQARPGQKTDAGQQLGWGSNIQNARLARAAELALKRGDHALALDYAQRAAQAAPNDAQLWFLLGYAARLDGKYGQSVDAYRKGLQIQPSSVNGESGLAQTYSMMGRSSDAERILKEVLASDPRQTDDWLLLGNLQMQSGDYNDALDALGKAERMAPGARSELLLATSYERLNQMDQANHYLQLAKSRAPNNPDVERSLAGYYRSTGDNAKAIQELKAIRSPKPDVVAELAFTYGLNGNLEDSARTYARAADAMPRDLGLQLSAAQAQIAANAMEKSTPFLDRAAKLDPNYYRLHAIRGEIAQIQDHDEDAAREYSAAVQNLPATPVEGPLYSIQLHMDLQALDQNLNEADLARKQLQIAQSQIAGIDEHGSDRAAFLRLRAQIEMSGGQEDLALNDMKASLALNAHDLNSLQLDGDVLVKLDRPKDAIAVYQQILAADPRNRFALTSIGYASRAAGSDDDAEKYFELLARDYPSLYIPYLALGDLYTEKHEYRKAESLYAKGHEAAPTNALIVAGGMNAAIEGHNLDLATTWLHRVTSRMQNVPRILAQRERYYYFENQPQQSEQAGLAAIQVLPKDRDVVVYLGYDLLSLEKYDELLALTKKYADLFPKEPDIPLLAGYVYKHNGERNQAVAEFSEALHRDPTVVTAYVNRGFVYNDLRKPDEAVSDFNEAISRDPHNGQAHLGLAFADLALNRNESAVKQSELAEDVLGDSKLYHTIRATAYGREGMLTKAATEYRAALKFTPDDGTLYLGLGSVYFSEQRYHESLAQLQVAQKYLTDNAPLYALEARAYASLHDRPETMRNVQLAEKYAPQMPNANDASPDGTGSPVSDIYISTGQALSTLGDDKAAMVRFSRALDAPHSNRVGVRMAIAQLMAQQGHAADAERQIALAHMESAAGDAPAMTGDQDVAAAGVLQQLHEYQLSEAWLERARKAGASDITVRVSLANDYLALGDTTRAAAELAAVSQTDDSRSDYQYLLAEANVYEQEHRGTQALSAFAQAANAGGEDQAAEQSMLQVGGNEGYRVNPRLSVLSNLVFQPVFEDSTVYLLDAKTFGNPPAITGSSVTTSLLPPPRVSDDTEWTTAYHLHFGAVPTGGYYQLRNDRGTISVPAIGIVNRNTTDNSFNFGVAPTLHIGPGVLTFNSGIQATIRRDSESPRAMNQNIGRVYTYVSSSSFFDAISFNGYFIRDSGPFTEIPLSESTLSGAIDFRVGSPWGKTALVTGWGSNDQQFTSQSLGNTENYYTSSYIGLTRRFSTHLNIEAILEDVRSWRVVPFVLPAGGTVTHSGTAQALRPAATIDLSPTRNWDIRAATAYEDTRTIHLYDMSENSLSVSYMRPFGRAFNDETGEVQLKYPIRFSAGVQEETFLNYTGGNAQQLRPYVSITLF
jgi:tetratricopeptide (TPR) repeat protein